MPQPRATVAVQLIGFPTREAIILESTLSVGTSHSHRYLRVPEGSLQQPDLFIANADKLEALTTLVGLVPSSARPALLIGEPQLHLSYACIPRPIRWSRLFEVLEQLVAERATVLAGLDATQDSLVLERRHRSRVDIDLTNPEDYRRMRRRAPATGSRVLVIDGTPELRDSLAPALKLHGIAIDWTDAQTLNHSGSPPALVLLNVAATKVNPYQLCAEFKQRGEGNQTAVVLLVGKGFIYDHKQAASVACDGFLMAPLSRFQLLQALNRFLPL
ncbi:MAG: response regulator [Herbaspirillum sp.]